MQSTQRAATAAWRSSAYPLPIEVATRIPFVSRQQDRGTHCRPRLERAVRVGGTSEREASGIGASEDAAADRIEQSVCNGGGLGGCVCEVGEVRAAHGRRLGNVFADRDRRNGT